MPRSPILVLLLAAASLTACGGDDGATTTSTPEGLDSITFTLTLADDGIRLRVHPGDEVAPRLPLSGPGDPGWVVVTAPNPAVLGGGDDLLFFPSEASQGVAYHEFDFIAVGPGEATVTLSHLGQSFSFTVEVAQS